MTILQICLDTGAVNPQEVKFLSPAVVRDFDPTPFLDEKFLRVIPESLCRTHKLLPIGELENEVILAAEEELSDEIQNKIADLTGLNCRVIVTTQRLAPIIDRAYLRLAEETAPHTKLGEALAERGLISQETLNSCLKEQDKTGERLGELLLRKGLVDEEDIYGHLSRQMGVKYVSFDAQEIDTRLAHMLPRPFAERFRVVPLRCSEDGELEVAMADPTDLMVQDLIRQAIQDKHQRLVPVLASSATINRALDYIYNSAPAKASKNEYLELLPEAQGEGDDCPTLSRAVVPEIRRMISQTLVQAIREGASDVHIENWENQICVRFRIDGILQDRRTPITKQNIDHVISVLKIDSNLDITERRRPQDGVFKRRLGQDRMIDFRLNTHTTVFGQDAVIRILDRCRDLVPLTELGISEETLNDYLRLLHNPQGLILITGPTGSGKTTTLYSSLLELDRSRLKIVTAEDPVEYHLERVCQYQVNSSIGNTFAEYGRRFLRQDPDAMLIGEIRDGDTVDACISAAMTGHLVFSTLHTNDSLGAISRLRDLGADSHLMADSLLAVMSQRLARRVCSECRRSDQPEESLLREFYPSGTPGKLQFYTGTGCSNCHGTGYKGRVGLYEFWPLTSETRALIAADADEAQTREKAIRSGLKPLLWDALAKVESGLTNLEEIRRVIPLEQIHHYSQRMGELFRINAVNQ